MNANDKQAAMATTSRTPRPERRALQMTLVLKPFAPRVISIPLWRLAAGLGLCAAVGAWLLVDLTLATRPLWSPFFDQMARSSDLQGLLTDAASADGTFVPASPFALPLEAAEPATQGTPPAKSSAPRPLLTARALEPVQGRAFLLQDFQALADDSAVNVRFRMAGTSGALQRGSYTAKAIFKTRESGLVAVEPTGTPGEIAYAVRNFADRSHSFAKPAPGSSLASLLIVVKDQPGKIAATFEVDMRALNSP